MTADVAESMMSELAAGTVDYNVVSDRPVLAVTVGIELTPAVLALRVLPHREVVILRSDDERSRQAAGRLAGRAGEVPVRTLVLQDVHSASQVTDDLDRGLARLGVGLDRVQFSATSGTKPTTVGILELAQRSGGAPVSYLDAESRQLRFLLPDGASPIPVHSEAVPDVPELIAWQAGGYRAVVDPTAGAPSRAAVLLGAHYPRLRGFLDVLRRLARFSRPGASIRRKEVPCELQDRVLHAAAQEGLLQEVSPNRWKIGEASRARFFFEGGWLEEYVQSVVERIPELRAVERGLKIYGGTKATDEVTDLDVVCVHGTDLVWISCKARSDFGQIVPHIFEMKAMYRLIGGLRARCILATTTFPSPGSSGIRWDSQPLPGAHFELSLRFVTADANCPGLERDWTGDRG